MNIIEQINHLNCVLDSREKNTSEIFKIAGVKYESKTLDIGDLETLTHLFEIKWDGDLMSSLNSKHIDEQLQNLSRRKDRIPVLIVAKTTSFHQNSKLEMLNYKRAVSLCQKFGIYIVHC